MTQDTRSVVIERDFGHPPEKVWRALTQPHLIAEWLMQNDFEPVVGRRFTLRAPANPHWNGIVECEVQVVEPQRKLAYSWGALGLGSVVTFTLEPIAAGVRLRMEQTGFRPDQEQNYQGAKFGWQRFFTNLEQVLARTD